MDKNELLNEIADTMGYEKDALYEHVLDDLKIDSYPDDVHLIDMVKFKIYPDVSLQEIIDATRERCTMFVQSYRDEGK
jgi:hypothetical protein